MADFCFVKALLCVNGFRHTEVEQEPLAVLAGYWRLFLFCRIVRIVSELCGGTTPFGRKAPLGGFLTSSTCLATFIGRVRQLAGLGIAGSEFPIKPILPTTCFIMVRAAFMEAVLFYFIEEFYDFALFNFTVIFAICY